MRGNQVATKKLEEFRLALGDDEHHRITSLTRSSHEPRSAHCSLKMSIDAPQSESGRPIPVDKHPDSVPELLASLRHLVETDKKVVRSTVHIYPAALYANNGQGSSSGHARARDRRITSWKMKEHLYHQANNPFPTLARGLFTEEVMGRDGQVEDKIVARGYDKFFNIGETAWTAVSRLVQARGRSCGLGWAGLTCSGRR